MRLKFALGTALALALACGGDDASPEPVAPQEAAGEAEAPGGAAATPGAAGTCCCATNEFAGAGAPKLPVTQACGAKPWEEGCVSDGLCHLDGPLGAGLIDARGGDVGVARTVSFLTFRDEPFDLRIPAGAAVSHPKSQLVVTRGPASELQSALANSLAQAGYLPDGAPELASEAQTETYGEFTQAYAKGESRVSLSVAAKCAEVPGLACIWVR